MADTPARTLRGGCLCGRVRYEVTPESDEGYYCHCRMCQLAFGNTRATFLNLRKDELRWLGAQPTYYASSKIARRGFCNRCGTPLTFEYLDSERMDISVGSLDDPGAFRPTTHFGVESRIASWHTNDGLPEERIDEHAKIMERWKASYGESVVPGVAAARQA